MSPLTRRTALHLGAAAVGGGLAGCVSARSRTTPSATPSATPPSGYWRWVTVVAHDPPPKRHQVGLSMEVVQPWITADETARIEVTLANNADTAREVGPVVDDPEFPANGMKGIVLWDKTGSPKTHASECIGTDGKVDEAVGYSGASRLPHKLRAGETTTQTLIISDDANNRGCIPPDTYPFEIGHVVRPWGETGGDETTYTWSFTLGIRGDE